MTSIVELQSLYRIVLTLKKNNDKDFGGVSRTKKFVEEFGSEKQFLQKLGVSKGDYRTE